MATRKVKTPEELEEERLKKEAKMSAYKKKAIQNIEEWLEKVRADDWTVDQIQLTAHKGCVTIGVNSNRNEYSRYY